MNDQGMHTPPDSTSGGDWVLGECFQSVHLGDEVPLGCGASGWDVPTARGGGDEQRGGGVGGIQEEIRGGVPPEVLHSFLAHMVQRSTLQGHAMEPPKKKGTPC